MSSIRIQTHISGDLIIREVTGPSTDWKTMAREQIAREVMNTKDVQVREALIRMGWTPPSTTTKQQDADVTVLEAAVSVVSSALDDLVDACMGSDGKPCAPEYRALMRARGMLPPRCRHALKKA